MISDNKIALKIYEDNDWKYEENIDFSNFSGRFETYRTL